MRRRHPCTKNKGQLIKAKGKGVGEGEGVDTDTQKRIENILRVGVKMRVRAQTPINKKQKRTH